MRDADGVYVVPIGYGYASGALYAHTAPGKKLRLMRLWPHIALLVDDVHALTSWRSVLIQGRFQELSSEEERFHARLTLLRAFDGDQFQVTAGHGHQTTLAESTLFRIAIDAISGRSQPANWYGPTFGSVPQ